MGALARGLAPASYTTIRGTTVGHSSRSLISKAFQISVSHLS